MTELFLFLYTVCVVVTLDPKNVIMSAAARDEKRQKTLPSWWYRIGERETIYLKAAGWRFILLCLHHPFHLALLVTFFVLTSEIECATIGLFFGPEGMCGKWPLLYHQGEIGLSPPWVQHDITYPSVSPFFNTKQIVSIWNKNTDQIVDLWAP